MLANFGLVSGFVSPTGTCTSQSGVVSRETTRALHGTSGDNFVRLSPRTARGNRQLVELETAVTSLERTLPSGATQKVELHAQIHFGSHDYFEYFNTAFDSFSAVHYELLVDDHMLQSNSDGTRSLRPSKDGSNVLMASPADRQMAQQYGLACQVDVVDCAAPHWIHADLTRQEFLALTNNPKADNQQPLWALASTAPTWPGAEAVSAIFRPSTPSTPSQLVFNLFLPGSPLATLLRLLFWFLIPSPELSVMVLDWSNHPTGGVSPVLVPVLQSLLTGNIQEARQLVFGQTLVSGQRSGGKDDLLIRKRNEHAMDVVLASLENEESSKTALLYGAMHCHDLLLRLRSAGFTSTKTTWRSAWSVRVPSFGAAERSGILSDFVSVASPNAIAVGLVVLPAYLLLGGLDWVSSWHELLQSQSLLDAGATEGLYLIRHVALYLVLAKFVVEWDGTTNLFDAER